MLNIRTKHRLTGSLICSWTTELCQGDHHMSRGLGRAGRGSNPR